MALDATRHVSILRFTGGTTATGKCAMYTMDHFLACRDSFYAQRSLLRRDQQVSGDNPTIARQLSPFLPTFFSGGATYTLNSADLVGWCEAVQRERITHSLLVPTLLYRLLDMNSARTYDLASLRTLIYGAAPIAPAAVGRLVEEFGPIFAQLYWRDRDLDVRDKSLEGRSYERYR